jgi:hypothetical protein
MMTPAAVIATKRQRRPLMREESDLDRDKAELKEAAKKAEDVAEDAKEVAEDAAQLAAKLKKDARLEEQRWMTTAYRRLCSSSKARRGWFCLGLLTRRSGHLVPEPGSCQEGRRGVLAVARGAGLRRGRL